MTAPKMELRRAPEPAPTEPGWYYTRPFVGPAYKAVPEIIPIRVVEVPDSPRVPVVLIGAEKRYAVGWDWFGPVPTCLPSGGI